MFKTKFIDNINTVELPYCNIAGHCVYLPGWVTIQYFCYYIMFMRILVNFPKAHEVTTNITSMIACWAFLYSSNLNSLSQYYWYDLVLSIIHYDYAMITHHIGTLFIISKCPSFADYEIIGKLLYLIKSMDIVMHHYKITNGLQLESLFPVGIRIWQLMTILYTIIMWIIGRIIIPATFILGTIEFQSKVILVSLIAANIFWIQKLWNLCLKIKKALIEQIEYL